MNWTARTAGVALGVALAHLAAAQGQQSQQSPGGVTPPRTAPAAAVSQLPNKPDLKIESMVITSTTAKPGGTLVTIEFTIYNASPVATRSSPTRLGLHTWHTNGSTLYLFECWFDMRDYPNGTFPPLGGGRAMELGPWGRAKHTDQRFVPTGKRVQFRATADSTKWIAEANERNNSETLIWPPE